MSEQSETVVDGLPPGPRLPLLLQSLLFWQLGNAYSRYCARRFGRLFTVRALPWGRVVLVADPDLIREIFTGPPELFHAGEGNSLLAPVLGERSVLVLDEEEHLASRKRLLPPFHGEAVRRYEQVIEEVVKDEIARWPIGRPFALHPRMRAITLEVILRAVIGVEEPERLAALRELLPRTVEIPFHITLMWVLRPLEKAGPWKRFRRTNERANDLLRDEIHKRREAPDLEQREDILSLLIRGGGMDDDELRDQIMTLLLAGHETTTAGLAWAFERLLRNPETLARAQVGEDDYLDAVVQETLRVRPVIAAVARRLTRPAELGGYVIPAGVTIMPDISLVHDSSDIYAEPRAFRPERFLEERAGTYTWFPFGGGRRRCIGAAFASFEMRVVLRTVLASAQLRAVGERPERARTHHITLVPAKGTLVTVTARKSPRTKPRQAASAPRQATRQQPLLMQ